MDAFDRHWSQAISESGMGNHAESAKHYEALMPIAAQDFRTQQNLRNFRDEQLAKARGESLTPTKGT